MLSKCVVEPDMNTFQKWLEDASDWRGKVAPIAQGQIFYNQRGCVACHNTTGAPGGTGPTWKDMFGNTIPLADGGTLVADEAYVKESILDPQAKIHKGFGPPSPMPSFKGAFKDYDIEAITVLYEVNQRQLSWTRCEAVHGARSQSRQSPPGMRRNAASKVSRPRLMFGGLKIRSLS